MLSGTLNRRRVRRRSLYAVERRRGRLLSRQTTISNVKFARGAVSRPAAVLDGVFVGASRRAVPNKNRCSAGPPLRSSVDGSVIYERRQFEAHTLPSLFTDHAASPAVLLMPWRSCSSRSVSGIVQSLDWRPRVLQLLRRWTTAKETNASVPTRVRSTDGRLTGVF